MHLFCGLVRSFSIALLLSSLVDTSNFCYDVERAFINGNVYSDKNNFENAMVTFTQGVQAIEKMNGTEISLCNTVHKLYHNLALKHSELGHVHEAKEFFLKALENKVQGTSLVQLGVFLSSIDEIDSAFQCLQKAQEFFPDARDLDILAATIFPIILKSSESRLDSSQHHWHHKKAL